MLQTICEGLVFLPKKHCQTTPEPFVEEKYTSLIEFS